MKQLLLIFVLGLVVTTAFSGVSKDEAQRLHNELTPLGAERAGNPEGTIPAWLGGLSVKPPCHVNGARYCNPYSNDPVLFTITAQNLDKWRDKLADGQIDLLLRHPETYRIPVYPTRRSFANPPEIYKAAYDNALSAVLMPSGKEIRDAKIAIPFPITKEGVGVIWNHRLRYRGPGFRRWISQATVIGSGETSLLRMREDANFPYAQDNMEKKGPAIQWLQLVLQPERLRGDVTLIHDTINAEDYPTHSWQKIGSALRIHRARSYGYDHSSMVSDDLRLDDQLDSFFGSPERYTWRLLDKRDMIVPYNSYALHSGRNALREIIAPSHIDPALARYELHRVWIIEATTKPSAIHRINRRRFYVDEDSWQILMVDLYDRDGYLWRWQETHSVMAYDHLAMVPVLETIHDLQSGRYLVQGIDEGDPERVQIRFDDVDDFDDLSTNLEP